MLDVMSIVSVILLVVLVGLLVAILLRLPSKELSQIGSRLDSNARDLERIEGAIGERASQAREEADRQSRALREELGGSFKQLREEVLVTLKGFNDSVLRILGEMSRSMEGRGETLKATVEARLLALQEDNTKKLEEMRKTVDEKLQGTLEKRLSDSFRLVSERLEQVHKGLGEMQSLAAGVGDLKKVLTNVKTRGTFGEIQLGNLLEQIFAPDQYGQNVATKGGCSERVEYAIKLPGRSECEGQVVWLPIDAKFPQEDYQRLIDAAEKGNAGLVDESTRRLEACIKGYARDIRDKYLDPPNTTDFALMFLPTEGLYAEVLRRPGLLELLQRDYHVLLTGPTTLAAVLNSLQTGFRTLAIQRRSSEVWKVLEEVKGEFGKFGGVIDKVQKKLQEASNVVGEAATRSRAIERKLRKVQELPAADSQGDRVIEIADHEEEEELGKEI